MRPEKNGRSSLQLITSVKRRDSKRDRFESLVRPHFDSMYASARRLTLSPHDAQDLVQDVCLKAFTRLDELASIEFPRAWLLKVLFHEFIDSERRNRRAPTALSSTDPEMEELGRFAADGPSPDELVEHEQGVERVLTAMRILNSDECALVLLHDVEGFSIEELCALKGAPAGTIKAQLHRTRARLGRLLSRNAMAGSHLKVVGGKQ